jgi:hypothetical protein
MHKLYLSIHASVELGAASATCAIIRNACGGSSNDPNVYDPIVDYGDLLHVL